MHLPRRTPVLLALALALGGSPAAVAAPDRAPDAAPDGGGARELTSTDLDVPTSGVGHWSVTPASTGGWEVAWTSPTPLPVRDARARVVLARAVGDLPAGALLGEADVSGSTASLVLPAGPAPTAEDLDLRLGTRVLDEPLSDVVSAPTVPLSGLPPTVPGPGAGRHRVVVDAYTEPGVALPGLDRPVELSGRVAAPADATDTSPLVVLLPGRHATCHDGSRLRLAWPCPSGWRPVASERGLAHLQHALARQGYVTVAVSTAGVDAQDSAAPDGGALARARLVHAHLDLWAEWVAAGSRRADLGRAVLLGHGRGGEGAAVASLAPPPESTARVAGLVLLAPTNLGRRATPGTPTVVVLPSCDGDVADLGGQSYVDAGRGVLHRDALHSSVLLLGADHDSFNARWTAGGPAAAPGDDWAASGPCAPGAPGASGDSGDSERLAPPAQRAAARAYVSAAVALLAGGRERWVPLFDGSARVAGVPALSHALGGELRLPGADGTPVASDGATASPCPGLTSTSPDSRACGHDAVDPWAQPAHWPAAPVSAPTRSGLEVSWDAAGATAGVRLDEPWDVSDAGALSLRVVVDPASGPVSLGVRLTDASGRSADVPATALAALPGGGESASRLWAQSLRVPLPTTIDLGALSQVELVAGSPTGRAWLLDLSGPATSAARVPVLDLGSVRVREGDGRGVARVPYRLSAPLASPGTVRLATTGPEGVRRRDVTVPAGRTRGTLPWPVRGDTAPGTRQVPLAAYAVQGVAVRDGLGSVRLVDDDPTPVVRVRPLRDRVAEGGSLAWVVTVRPAPADPPYLTRRLVRAEGRPSLSLEDLPVGVPAYTEGALPATSRQRWVVRVPIRRDGLTEPAEAVTVRLALPELGFTRDLPGLVLASR